MFGIGSNCGTGGNAGIPAGACTGGNAGNDGSAGVSSGNAGEARTGGGATALEQGC